MYAYGWQTSPAIVCSLFLPVHCAGKCNCPVKTIFPRSNCAHYVVNCVSTFIIIIIILVFLFISTRYLFNIGPIYLKVVDDSLHQDRTQYIAYLVRCVEF